MVGRWWFLSAFWLQQGTCFIFSLFLSTVYFPPFNANATYLQSASGKWAWSWKCKKGQVCDIQCRHHVFLDRICVICALPFLPWKPCLHFYWESSSGRCCCWPLASASLLHIVKQCSTSAIRYAFGSTEWQRLVQCTSYLFDTKILLKSSIGVAVGAGWQSVVAYVNITSYYLIGIPLGGVLGYAVGLHVKVRLWNLALTCLVHLGCKLCSSLHLVICCVGHLDWHAARNTGPNYCASVHNIKDRLGKTGILVLGSLFS